MSAVERLAEAFASAFPVKKADGSMKPPSESRGWAQAILATDPQLAEALETGLAWQEVEAALPEGAWIGLTGPWSALGPDKRYVAEIRATRFTEGPSILTVAGQGGPTPAAALRALAESLRESRS